MASPVESSVDSSAPVHNVAEPVTYDPHDDQVPGRFLISDLCQILEQYLDSDQVAEVYRAYLLGAQAHEGQHRQSGEPYIFHPLAVARILAEMRMDTNSIIAALLHDVIEDTPTLKSDLECQFGTEVAELVDGVSKLTRMDDRSKAEFQADNFRKMMLAMARDIRVILIKLADRLHNMRTLDAMRADKRRRISLETMDIYVPIANRLGMYKVRHELLTLSFENAYPMRYRILEKAMRKAMGNRKEIFITIEDAIRSRLEQVEIKAEVAYRQKNLHSIYRKMKKNRVSFRELNDVFGVRILAHNVDDCYRILGVMHNLFKPLPGRFKDYLAIPKANGYQSLHSTLFGPNGIPVEVQIRTFDMNRFAESGIAAHWLYKEGGVSESVQSRSLEWLKELLEMQQKAGSSLEFLENVKVDLFPDEIYVFTPKGDIKKLPRGSTVVDFAYSVHTDIGHTCVAGRIDHRMAPLSTQLVNGQTIEIITASSSCPHPSWLDFVVTARARSSIRHFLKSMQHNEALELGQRLLKQSLAVLGRDLDVQTQEQLQVLAETYRLPSSDQLLIEIGLGNRASSLVVKALSDADDDAEEVTQYDQHGDALAIKGTEGMVVSYARCCRPVPGDAVLGFMSSGKGIVVHRQDCKNMKSDRHNPDLRHLPVQWSEHVEGEFSVTIKLEVVNQRGALAKLAGIISDQASNIENVNLSDREGNITTIEFVLSVRDRIHLARIMRKLRRVSDVNRIWRV